MTFLMFFKAKLLTDDEAHLEIEIIILHRLSISMREDTFIAVLYMFSPEKLIERQWQIRKRPSPTTETSWTPTTVLVPNATINETHEPTTPTSSAQQGSRQRRLEKGNKKGEKDDQRGDPKTATRKGKEKTTTTQISDSFSNNSTISTTTGMATSKLTQPGNKSNDLPLLQESG
ncbi:hypothetical protein CHS0354_040979 [Potamilus streckersoni]|uniref:Uncharacterized protein n=1 Tax=Potamilus streckersoni TaxID=2493646 RepID=A0AAE0T8U4_9BIVA|nr:hypothetical protein CHS0354_040979 [Potamilus streckersoni]